MSDDEIKVGDFVPHIGDRRQPKLHMRVDKYGLDKMAEKAQERPGVPLLAGRDIPFSYTNSLRSRSRDPYVTDDGQIKVSIKGTGKRTEDDTDRLVDVYFTWHEFPPLKF